MVFFFVFFLPSLFTNDKIQTLKWKLEFLKFIFTDELGSFPMLKHFSDEMDGDISVLFCLFVFCNCVMKCVNIWNPGLS